MERNGAGRQQLETLCLKIGRKGELQFCGKQPTVTSYRTERNKNFPFVWLRSIDCIRFRWARQV
uniref:Uncharacterized protein n=1 Tax=Romanomermis culicivorax TaxID=13658 RepID=A0A915I5P6_ROMCU